MKSLLPLRATNRLMEPFRQEFEELVDRFFTPETTFGDGAAVTWAPRVDVEETEKDILVRADLPGVEASEVEISFSNGSLILKGEKKEKKEEKGRNYHRVERFYGNFYREVPLPTGVEAEKIAATCSKGVITVTIPKKPEAQAKKIVVKALD